MLNNVSKFVDIVARHPATMGNAYLLYTGVLHQELVLSVYKLRWKRLNSVDTRTVFEQKELLSSAVCDPTLQTINLFQTETQPTYSVRLFWAVATFWRLRSVPLPPRYSCGRRFCKTGGGYRSSNGCRGPVYNVDSTTLGVGSQVESGAQQQCWRLCLDKQIALLYPLTNPPPTKPPREAVDLQLCFLQTNPYITNPKVFLSLIEFLNAFRDACNLIL